MKRLWRLLFGWLRPHRGRPSAFAVPRAIARRPTVERTALATHLLARRPDPPAD